MINGELGDANMMDTGDQGRLIGEPPDGRSSWAQKVIGGGSGGRPRPEDVVDEAFVMERLRLEFPDGMEGEPVVTIGTEVLEAMNGLWKNCIIVKVLGKNIAIPTLTRKLREVWKPTGGMSVMDLPRHFFMIRFELESEYLAALTGGPWRVFGSYLLVQGWTPEFDPMRDEITTTPVWVRLSNIPVNFYHPAILMGIARGVGKPVRVNLTTLNMDRARFARVCVEVNLTRPLKGSMMINGERYFVLYEGLGSICSGCGVYGHLVHNCPSRVSERVAKPAVIPTTAGAEVQGRNPEHNEDGFTVVTRRPQRRSSPENVTGTVTRGSSENPERILSEISGNQNMERPLIANRFENLSTDMEVADLRDTAKFQEVGKENEVNIPNDINGKGTNGGREDIRFGASGPGQNGPGVGIKSKQVGRGQGGLGNTRESGVRPKKKVQAGPTKGLIFGPSRSEVDRSESGKRLRTEDYVAGRSGGARSNTSSQNDMELFDTVIESSSVVPSKGLLNAQDKELRGAPLRGAESPLIE